MIVDVIPFIRLPRQLVSFSYNVPDYLAPHLLIGQYVSIPFRSQKISGLVVGVKHENSSGLKSLEKIINPIPLIGADYLNHLKNLATFYGVSLSVVTSLALPPQQTRKIMEMEIAPWQKNTTAKIGGIKPTYHWYKTDAEHTEAYVNYSGERIVIIVPEVTRITEVTKCLPTNRQSEVLVWSSELSQKDQRIAWFAIRNHEARTMVATRGALWLPLHQSFDRIILDYEHSENHKHWDQTPRYHTKDLAKLLSKNFGLNYTEMSFSASVASYYFIHNKNYAASISTTQFDSPVIVQQAPNFTEKGKIFTQTIEHIQNQLKPGADIVVIHNQKGSARQTHCRDCAWVGRCPKCDLPMIFHKDQNILLCHYCNEKLPVPLVCPRCSSTNLGLLGAGIEAITREIKEKITESEYQIIQVSADTPLEEITDPTVTRIIVATHSVLGTLNWNRVAVIALLDCDTQLNFPEYSAEETVWHTIQDIVFHKKSDAPFIIQTKNPEHHVFSRLNQPDTWYAEEIKTRESLGYPPFSYLVRYLIPGKTEIETKRGADTVAGLLTQQLTRTKKKIILQGPIAAEPKYARGSYWQVIMLKILESDILSTVLETNTMIGNKIKIDPHPISLVNPH